MSAPRLLAAATAFAFLAALAAAAGGADEIARALILAVQP